MHFKFDENADPRWRVPLEEAGNTVSTVTEERLQGQADVMIAAVCRSLDMCLLTLDVDFAQTTAYPPADYPGIIVRRHPKPTLGGMLLLVRSGCRHAGTRVPSWPVMPGRIRMHG